MKAKILKSAALSGTLLVLIYTAIISTADGITKLLAGGYAAPQLYAISGGLVVLFTLLADRVKRQSEGMRTTKPGAMALRAAMTVLSTICYFYSFRLLPFAEVFIFIGMVPIFAGVFSGLILREHVRLQVWLALAAGFIGVLMIFPEGLHSVTLGHAVALVASLVSLWVTADESVIKDARKRWLRVELEGCDAMEDPSPDIVRRRSRLRRPHSTDALNGRPGSAML